MFQTAYFGCRTISKEVSSTKASCLPMVILIHGTFGANSIWAIPDQSPLVKALRLRFGSNLDFQRLPWSGCNGTGARIEAAERLAEMLRSTLTMHTRPIFLLAHSHGGNIAIRAFNALSEAERKNVEVVLMGTPFLLPSRLLDFQAIVRNLPKLGGLGSFGCALAFWFIIQFAIEVLERLFVPAAYRISILFGDSWSQHPVLPPDIPGWPAIELAVVILLFFFPFYLFMVICKRASRLLGSLQQTDTVMGPLSLTERVLVVTYQQDEAFQFLSVVINLLAIVHQAFFLVVFGFARLASRTKIFDLILTVAWLTMMVGVLLVFVVWAITGGLSLLSQWIPYFQHPLEVTSKFFDTIYHYSFDVGMYGGQSIILISFVVGFVALAVVASMLLNGIVRIVIYWLIGVAEHIHTPSMFLSALLSTVSISMIPEGGSESFVIPGPGRTLLNHVKIYDDERVISRIIDFIQTGLSAEKRE